MSHLRFPSVAWLVLVLLMESNSHEIPQQTWFQWRETT